MVLEDDRPPWAWLFALHPDDGAEDVCSASRSAQSAFTPRKTPRFEWSHPYRDPTRRPTSDEADTGVLGALARRADACRRLVSVVDFELAQRLELQEKSTRPGALFSRLDRNTPSNITVLWTAVPVAILMLAGHSWWPWLAVAAGGIHLDTGGRELASSTGFGCTA
jgi:hypothetical protein